MARYGVLFLIENLPIPLDRRVLLEATAIRETGMDVFVICPRGIDTKLKYYETLPNGIRVYRYPNPPDTNSKFSYFFEFAYCLFITFALALWIFIFHGFHVIHSANPPDTFFTIAWMFKIFSVKYIYDQHDLCPELFISKFGTAGGILLKAQYFLESMNYRSAYRVIVPNQSYRSVALERGNVPPEHVTIVRSGPNRALLNYQNRRVELRRNAEHVIVYLGVMGSQDGVDILLNAFAKLLETVPDNREKYLLILIGNGEKKASLEKSAEQLGIADRSVFTGFLHGTELLDHLAVSDIGISPDPPTCFNTLSTMNKVLEYMAFGIPVVAFDLKETRYSAGEAAVYVTPDTPEALAKAMDELLRKPELRKRMGKIGRERIRTEFNWEVSREKLIGMYYSAHLLPSAGSENAQGK